jgi:hypothetical protein
MLVFGNVFASIFVFLSLNVLFHWVSLVKNEKNGFAIIILKSLHKNPSLNSA